MGPRGVSTLTAFANGDASLLHETGSGIIGRQNHVHVVNQAKALVAKAAGALYESGKSQLSVRVPDDPAERFPAVVRAADVLLAVQRAA